MRVDGEAIGNVEAQFAYVYLRLDSSPAALCLEMLKHANLTQDYDYRLLLDQLNRHNGVENKVQRARTKLYGLSQGSTSFHKYLVTFEVTLGEASGWNWEDDRKIDALRAGLSDYLVRKLQERDANGTTPTEYLEFVALCKRYSSSGSHTQPPASASSSSRQLYDPKADKMDLSAIQLSSIDQRSSSGSPSRSRSRRSHSSGSRHSSRSRCFRCGATDHYIAVCSVQPTRPKSPPAVSTNTNGPTRTIQAPLIGKRQWGLRIPASHQSSDDGGYDSEESNGPGFC